MTNNNMDDAISRYTFQIQGELVQLEGSISYQVDQDWKDENVVLEKIEDVKREVTSLMTIGQNLGRLTKEQERQLERFYSYLSKYPEYSGYSNNVLSSSERKMFEILASNLSYAGWGMNNSYSGGWDQFIEKSNQLFERSIH